MGYLLVDCQTGQATMVEGSRLGIDEVHEGPVAPTAEEIAAQRERRRQLLTAVLAGQATTEQRGELGELLLAVIRP